MSKKILLADDSVTIQKVVSITLASGAQLSDVLKRAQVNWRQRMEAFTDLVGSLLEKPIQNGAIPGYERLWRGSRRSHARCEDEAGPEQGDGGAAGDRSLPVGYCLTLAHGNRSPRSSLRVPSAPDWPKHRHMIR